MIKKVNPRQSPFVSSLKIGSRVNGKINGMYRVWQNGIKVKETYYQRAAEDLAEDSSKKLISENVENLMKMSWVKDTYERPNRSSLTVEKFNNGQISKFNDYVRGNKVGMCAMNFAGKNLTNFKNGVYYCFNWDPRVQMRYINFIGPEVMETFSGSLLQVKGQLLDVYGRVLFTGDMKSNSNSKFIPHNGV